MIVTKKSFILVEEPGSTFIVNSYLERLLRKKMQPILWHRNGMFCVVPVAILENVLGHIDMYAKLFKQTGYSVTIDWKQTWPITDPRPICTLSGLDY